MVDLLISKGCNIFAKSKVIFFFVCNVVRIFSSAQQGYGALAMACWKGNVAIAEKLIRFGLDVNKSEAVGGNRYLKPVVFISLFSLDTLPCTGRVTKGILNLQTFLLRMALTLKLKTR